MNVSRKSTVSAVKKPTKTSNIVYDLSGIPENWEDINDLYISMVAIKRNSKFSLMATYGIDSFCCGLCSIGDFNINYNSSSITHKEKVECIKQGLRKFMKTLKPNNREITVQFTLIDNNACNLIAEAVEDGEIFTKVKTFTNLNSGRVNDLYISN